MDLLINVYGTRIRSRGERIRLVFPKKTKAREYPARRLDKIVILRPSSISTGAVELAIEHGIDIVYLGSFGTPVGRIFPSRPQGLATLRRRQVEASSSSLAFRLAKEFVRGKTTNQITYLRQLESETGQTFGETIVRAETIIESLDRLPNNSFSYEQLLGFEGYIADKYFGALARLYRFPGRKPRARDKFNSALNYGYGILYNEVERACLYVGLDPYLGLYHTERYGKSALVLDLVEEFRVPLVDAAIFPLFLKGHLGRQTNYQRIAPGEYRLSPEGKRSVVEAVYTQFNKTVRWGGKKRAAKIVIEYQARTLAQVFLGSKGAYRSFDYRVMLESL